jgi:hypothetical protein
MLPIEGSNENHERSADPHVAVPHERAPADVERQVMRLSVNSSLEELSAALDASEWLLARAKTIDHLMRQIAIRWIDRNGCFTIGQMVYSVGFSLDVKCLDIPKTGHAVLDAAGGDIDQFFSVLVAQPFKHGSVRNLIGEKMHDCLFMHYRTGKLVNEVPERILKRADKRFLSKPASR